jgi:hypothetical protein
VSHSDVHISTRPNYHGYIYYYILFNHHTNANDTIWGATQDDVVNQTNTAFATDEAEVDGDSTTTKIVVGVVLAAIIIGIFVAVKLGWLV